MDLGTIVNGMAPARQRAGRRAAACLCAVLLAGCATTGDGTSAGAGSGGLPGPVADVVSMLGRLGGFLEGRPAQMRRLVEADRLDEARALYLEYRDKGDWDSDKGREAVGGLVAALNARALPRITELSDAVRSLDAAAGPGTWEAAGETFRQVADLMANTYAADPLLSDPDKQPVELAALREQWLAARDAFLATGPRALAAYDPARSPSFFDAYPVPFPPADRQALLRAQAPAWAQAMASMPVDVATRVLRQYVDEETEPAVRRRLAGAWMAAYGRQQGWKSMSPAQRQQARQALAAAVPAAGADKQTVALVPVAGPDAAAGARQGLDARAQKLARHFGAQALPAMDPARLQQGLAELRESYDVVILADLGRLEGSSVAVAGEPQKGRYLARHESRPNPRRGELQQELAEAQRRLAQAQREQRQVEQQMRSMSGQSRALAALGLVTTSAAVYGTASQRSQVESLQRELNDEPMSVQTPVYEPYMRETVTRKLVYHAPVVLYVSDASVERFGRLRLPFALRDEYSAPADIHPQDPDAKPMPASEHAGRESRLASSAAQALPDGLPTLDALVRTDPGIPLARLPQAFAEDAAWHRKTLEDESRTQREMAQAAEQAKARRMQQLAAARAASPASAGAAAGGCSDAELERRLEPALARHAPQPGMGICQAGRAMKAIAEEALRLVSGCPRTPAIQQMQESYTKLRDEAQQTVNGACA